MTSGLPVGVFDGQPGRTEPGELRPLGLRGQAVVTRPLPRGAGTPVVPGAVTASTAGPAGRAALLPDQRAAQSSGLADHRAVGTAAAVPDGGAARVTAPGAAVPDGGAARVTAPGAATPAVHLGGVQYRYVEISVKQE